MPVIDEDELGPWMGLGRRAIRPAGPTRFKLGEELDEFDFGGSTLHGVGKVAGMREDTRRRGCRGPSLGACMRQEYIVGFGQMAWTMILHAPAF